MLDIRFIRQNPKLVEEKTKQKGYVVDIKQLLKVDQARRKLIEEVDALRKKRNELAAKRDQKEGLKIKNQLRKKENDLERVNEEFYTQIRQIPNLPKDDVPEGHDENDNVVIREIGRVPKFNFKPKDHLAIGVALDLLDTERSAKVSGARFAFLKNELVSLEFAIVNFALDYLTDEGFIEVVPPVIINQKVIEGLGYVEYLSGEGFKVDGQYLVGTAEHSIVPMHMDEVFPQKELPKRYVAFSSAFRREAGSYGRDTRGIFRVHQFDKVEMISFVLPSDDDKEHKYLLALQEKMIKRLQLPYRVVNVCTGELGFPTARRYDIETWLPGEQKYRETHSASTTSTFQARRLNIKHKLGTQTDFVAILNATAFAIGRTIIAIMENFQQKDGSILIPKVLQKYTNFSKIPR